MNQETGYRRLGETFTFSGMKLTVKEWSHITDCEKCHFLLSPLCGSMACKKADREDGRNVYFEPGEVKDDIPFHPVGTLFKYRRQNLRVCASGDMLNACKYCYFKGCDCAHVPCTAARRADGQDVFFRLENGGCEPPR